MADNVTIIKGTNLLVAEVDGKKMFYTSESEPLRLLDTAWDDLRFPVSGINPLGAGADPTRNPTTGLLEFSASATNVVAFQAQLPHNWREGSMIYPHVHWAPATTNTGNVLWQLEYRMANVHGTLPAGFTTITVLDAGDGVADKHQIAPFAGISMTNMTLSCMVLCKLSRLGADGTDTQTGVAQLLEIDFHYEVDGFGSDEEYTK